MLCHEIDAYVASYSAVIIGLFQQVIDLQLSIELVQTRLCG